MLINNYSDSVLQAIHIAQSLAKERHNPLYTASHLLKALMHKDVGLYEFVRSIDKDDQYILEWAEIRIDEVEKIGAVGEVDQIYASEEVSRIFEESDYVRVKLGLDLITPICLLTAISKVGIAFDANQLKSFPIREREIYELFLKDDKVTVSISNNFGDNSGNKKHRSKSLSSLHKYCIDRLQLVRDEKTDPIIGRDKEVRMMMEILGRRSKPNVIITGDAGVGKTALVDGFALDIVNGSVPLLFQGIQLFELDLGALIAGAAYKGEIEDRLKNIISELKQFDKAVLFIDEIHVLLDSKGPVGGAGNLLKPELARGEITVIGATTLDEYRKIIEREQAFNRRFELLQISEPSEDNATRMVSHLSNKYETHHNLTVEEDSFRVCVTLAKRYMKERKLPDSAFDLLDRTMAAIKMMNETSKGILNEAQERLISISKNEAITDEKSLYDAYKWEYEVLFSKLSPVLLGMLTDDTQVENFVLAEEYRLYLHNVIDKLNEFANSHVNMVTKQDVFAVMAHKTGIPMGKLQAGEKEKLMAIEDYLKRRVVGQDQALKVVSDAILESRSGLNKKGQPIGSFFLLGPTGTGKTELAKSIAEFLFNDEKAMIRFDMSEFKEEHSAALLYGAPPGYVGYEEGGLLVNKIRQQPYSVLLFDEIEKAHPSVFDTFLQILDEGHMHDRLGKEGDFSNSLILFTSNIGSDWIAEQISNQATFPSHHQLIEIMIKYFRPEFLARISEIVPFAPINEENVVKIFDIQLKHLKNTLEKLGIGFEITDEAKKFIALKGFTPKYGARQLAAGIRNELSRPISKCIISGSLNKGQSVRVGLVNNEVDLQIVNGDLII